MNTTTRFKKTNTSIPRNLIEANATVRNIGDIQSQINEIESELATQVKNLKSVASKKLDALLQEQNNICTALFTFAEKQKYKLALDSKTVFCVDGEFGWRITPPKVKLGVTEKEAVELLKSSRRKRFVRIKESLDKEKLLAKRPVVPGVTYEQQEEFFVKPKNITNSKKTVTRTIDR